MTSDQRKCRGCGWHSITKHSNITMAPPVTRAVRLLSTVHASVTHTRSNLFTPEHFPKFLAVMSVSSGLAGFFFMDGLHQQAVSAKVLICRLRATCTKVKLAPARLSAFTHYHSPCSSCRSQEEQEIKDYLDEHDRRANDPHLIRRFTLMARRMHTQSLPAPIVSSAE